MLDCYLLISYNKLDLLAIVRHNVTKIAISSANSL